LCREKVFSNVEIVIFHVDRMSRAGAYTLPAEKAFGHVIPYGS